MLRDVLRDPGHQDRLSWAVRVRWLVIGGFLLLALLAHPFGLFPRVGVCVAAAAVGGGLNALNQLAVRRRRLVLAVTLIAVPMDHALTTGVVAFTGGVQSPFLMMYSVQVVATALLVTFSAAVASVLVGASCFGLLLWLHAAGAVEIAPLYDAWLLQSPERAAHAGAAAWLVFLLYCLALLIFVGGYVSERLRRSEYALAEKNARLEATVASLRATRDELSAAYERLVRAESQMVQSEKMRALGSLVAGVAHELNNPLSFVSANTAHLRSHCDRLAALIEATDRWAEGAELGVGYRALVREHGIAQVLADLPELVADCEEGARRATQIVRELRSFSAGAAGDPPDLFNLNHGIRSTVALLRHRLDGGVTLHADLAPLPEVRGWAGQMNQVFLNLLVNAADAIGDRGEIWVQTRLRHDRAAVLACVRDSGPGIGANDLPRIFDPFFTTKPVGQGTGLGLSISYGIVQRHGGTLTATNDPAGGAAFEIELPLATPRSDA